MAKPKTRRVAAGAGWAMLAVFLTTFGIRFTDLNEHHSKELGGVLIASSLFLLVALGFWFFTKDDAEALADFPEKKQDNSLKAGRDAIGNKQLKAKYLTYNEAAPLPAPEPQPKPDLAISPERKATIPRLKIVGLDRTIAREDGEFWRERLDVPGGDIVWVVRIENPFTTPYKRYDIAARLEFKSGSNEVGFVERAFWLDMQANTADIDIGKRKAVLLGIACSLRKLFLSFDARVPADSGAALFTADPFWGRT